MGEMHGTLRSMVLLLEYRRERHGATHGVVILISWKIYCAVFPQVDVE